MDDPVRAMRRLTGKARIALTLFGCARPEPGTASVACDGEKRPKLSCETEFSYDTTKVAGLPGAGRGRAREHGVRGAATDRRGDRTVHPVGQASVRRVQCVHRRSGDVRDASGEPAAKAAPCQSWSKAFGRRPMIGGGGRRCPRPTRRWCPRKSGQTWRWSWRWLRAVRGTGKGAIGKDVVVEPGSGRAGVEDTAGRGLAPAGRQGPGYGAGVRGGVGEGGQAASGQPSTLLAAVPSAGTQCKTRRLSLVEDGGTARTRGW